MEAKHAYKKTMERPELPGTLTTGPWAREDIGADIMKTKRQRIQGCYLAISMIILGTIPSLGLAQEDWIPKAFMSPARATYSTSVVDGKIYAIGGRTALPGTSQVSTVAEYDPATDRWTRKANMPTARYSLSTSVVDGKIYAIGGVDVGRSINMVEMYDPTSDTWSQKADMPVAMSGHVAGVVDGKIYVIAGKLVQIYNPLTDTWSRGADRPTQARWGKVSVVRGKIYSIGGAGGEPEWETLSTVEEYDPATDTWAMKADMPTLWHGFTTTALNGKVFVIGGYTLESGLGWASYKPLATVAIYDPASDTWTEGPPLTTPRSHLRASAVDGTIYALGGFISLRELVGNVEAYEPVFESVRRPGPSDAATDVFYEPVLQWTPSESAEQHDVYFGTRFEEVSRAGDMDPVTLDTVFRGRQHGNSYAVPEPLVFGQTYYWRIDEVSGPPDYAVSQGNTWSFTTEPMGHPIANVTATAWSSQRYRGPEKTIDGSGLNELDEHGTQGTDMWLSAVGDPSPSIQYEFDRVYKLHEMWVWNANQLIERFLGLGAKDVAIDTSTDGQSWVGLENVPQFAQAPGSEDYAHNTTVDLHGHAARFVRLTFHSAWGSVQQYGLSEVRFFAIPTYASRPQPADGAIIDSPDITLQWRPGREAVSHEVRLSTAWEIAQDGDAAVALVNEDSYTPAPLILGTTYTWQVNEINEAADHAHYVGDPWTFTTPRLRVVDDMERYQDREFHETWATWIDGFHDPANGSVVGNGTTGKPDTDIVHDGRQSLPIHFDNSAAASSEATQTFDPAQNWTQSGIQTLVLSFARGVDNFGNSQIYVKINNTKTTCPVDLSRLPPGLWTQWNIDLASLGADIIQVETLTIGIEGGGAQGVIYVDDILLYRIASEPTLQQVVTWFEAESGDFALPMERFTADPSASGGQYIGVPDLIGHVTSQPPIDGVATYSFDVPEDGAYRLAFRVLMPRGGDSFWVRVPGMVTNTANHASGWIRFNQIEYGNTWHWDEVHSSDDNNRIVEFTLAAGTHTLEIARQEAGTLLDTVALIR